MDWLRVGIFVMPGENETGELEDLLWQTIPDKNQVKQCVNKYLRCLEKNLQNHSYMHGLPAKNRQFLD
jgi:hypothetical protein